MIIFRCSSSKKIGLGHLMRCRALAHALNDIGHDCIMLGPSFGYKSNDDRSLFLDWVPLRHDLSSETDAILVSGYAKSDEKNFFVLDDYRVDSVYQKTFRALKLKWLQFDGSANVPLWANIVVNARPGACSNDYRKLLRSSETKLLLGLRYSMLRQEFSFKKNKINRNEIKKILICFGGGDDRGATIVVLKSILWMLNASINIVIVVGEGNQNLKEIKSLVSGATHLNIDVKVSPKLMAVEYADCDAAIISGGMISHEAAYYGLPMVLISIAENQRLQAKAWERFGVGTYLGDLDGLAASDIAAAFEALVNLAGEEICRIKTKLSVVDGFGTSRVAEEIDASMKTDVMSSLDWS